MKKRNLQLLALGLFLVLTQNSLAVKLEEGTGSEAASDETVAVGLSYTDDDGTVHKNIAGNPAEPGKKYFATAIGIANKASGEYSSAFGFMNEASESSSSAFGHKNKASGYHSLALGYLNTATGSNSSALGDNNKAFGSSSYAFGFANMVGKSEDDGSNNFIPDENFGNYSLALGREYQVAGNYSGAFGLGSYGFNYVTNKFEYSFINEGNNSYMIGNYNKIASGSDDNFILGNNVAIGAGVQKSVVLGDGSASGGSNTVSVGSSALQRKIVNVGEGEISATSTDAITGKQLYSGVGIDTAAWKAKLGVGAGGVDLSAYAKRNASNLTASDISAWKAKLGVGSGGGGGIANTATGTGSTGLGVDNTVTGNYSTAVGYKNKVTGNKSGAFGDPNLVTGNGSYAFGNDNTIKGDNNFVFGNNVTIDVDIQNSVALGNNSTVSSSNEVSVGSATLQRKITNVADGEVSATSTDAVTGKQLYKVMQNSGTLGIENLRNEVYEKIDNVKDEVRDVGSLSAALAGLHPMQYDPKAPAQVMAALGHYKDRQAVAVGASYYFNDRFMMSTGVALSGEKKTKAMANVGFTLKLGKGSGTTYNETPQYVVQNEVKRLTVENQELKTEINSLNTRNKEQDEKIKNLEEKLNMLLKNK